MKLLRIVEKYLICIILVVVASIQLYHSQFDRLTPWKGGGFGMFSTNKRANIAAVGYTASGDSIIIKVSASELDIPISESFLRSTNNFPTKAKLEKLGYLIVNSHLIPIELEIPDNIDRTSTNIIQRNQRFYDTVYSPKYYQSGEIAKSENAIKVDSVKIILYETDFFEKGFLFQKRYVDEIGVSSPVDKSK